MSTRVTNTTEKQDRIQVAQFQTLGEPESDYTEWRLKNSYKGLLKVYANREHRRDPADKEARPFDIDVMYCSPRTAAAVAFAIIHAISELECLDEPVRLAGWLKEYAETGTIRQPAELRAPWDAALEDGSVGKEPNNIDAISDVCASEPAATLNQLGTNPNGKGAPDDYDDRANKDLAPGRLM